MKIRITKDTVFKSSRNQLEDLKQEYKDRLPELDKILFNTKANTEYDLDSMTVDKNHYRIVLKKPSTIKGRNTWWVYSGHCEIIYDAGNTVNTPNVINLPVPYLSQRDNINRPGGTCNITSVAMCLAYFGVKPNSSTKQLEDQLYEVVANKGWDRHLHSDLAKLFNYYGFKDQFSTTTTYDSIKLHLAKKLPVIISGKFTRSGHIIVVKGFDEVRKAFIVNDPWGEWTSKGYINKTGFNLYYSYNLIHRLSYNSSSSCWAHLPSK